MSEPKSVLYHAEMAMLDYAAGGNHRPWTRLVEDDDLNEALIDLKTMFDAGGRGRSRRIVGTEEVAELKVRAP